MGECLPFDAKSVEYSPNGEAGSFSASQEILPILLKPKVHSRIHNISPVFNS
jgi:hypothetical protein